MGEADVQGRISRAAHSSNPSIHFLGLYRDLVISIGDGEVEDPVALCRLAALGELQHDWTVRCRRVSGVVE